MKTLKALLVLTVMLLSCEIQAQSNNLDQWLRAEAAPALARLMDREPRFIGERVQIAALTSGRVGLIDNALVADIRDTLRHQLMNRSRISFPLGAGDACSNDIQIVLGIEVNQTGRHEHRIQIALLDLGDDLWINDSSHIWEGRLSRKQLRSLTTPISVARATTTPLNHDPERAPVKSVHCLQEPAAEVELALLSPLVIDDRKVECRGESRHCVDVTYETYRDAIVFEFFTRSGELYALDCDERPKLHYGERRKGLRVPAAGHEDRPSLGFYVVATQDRDVARQIRQALHESSSSCEGFADAEALTRLTKLVASPAVDWQAILLRQKRGRVSRMEVST